MKHNESRELWRSRLADFHQSGLSITKWCTLNDIPEAAMKYHLYKGVGKEMSAHANSSNTISFVPATIIEAEVSESVPSVITLSAGKVTLSVDHATDFDLLRKIIQVLQS